MHQPGGLFKRATNLFLFIGIAIIAVWILRAVSATIRPRNVAVATPPISPSPVLPTASRPNFEPAKRVVSEPSETKPFEVPEIVSTMDFDIADPHICEKPDGAYFANYGPEIPKPAGSGGYSNPQFLFDLKHQDHRINWAQGFKGTVPVCFIVDERGNPADIRFLQSPGKDLEEHITERVNGWRYKPAMLKQNWMDNDPQPIRVQMAFDFIFR